MKEFEPTNHVMIMLTEDDNSPASPGGIVVRMIASGALLIGDSVLVSAADTVLKTVTATNHKNRFGIVVGGAVTYGQTLSGTDAVGLAAAADTEDVLVQISGVAWGVADAAIAVGAKLRLGTTTAGRLLTGTDTTDLVAGVTGLILAQALTAAAAPGDPVKVLIAHG